MSVFRIKIPCLQLYNLLTNAGLVFCKLNFRCEMQVQYWMRHYMFALAIFLAGPVLPRRDACLENIVCKQRMTFKIANVSTFAKSFGMPIGTIWRQLGSHEAARFGWSTAMTAVRNGISNVRTHRRTMINQYIALQTSHWHIAAKLQINSCDDLINSKLGDVGYFASLCSFDPWRVLRCHRWIIAIMHSAVGRQKLLEVLHLVSPLNPNTVALRNGLKRSNWILNCARHSWLNLLHLYDAFASFCWIRFDAVVLAVRLLMQKPPLYLCIVVNVCRCIEHGDAAFLFQNKKSNWSQCERWMHERLGWLIQTILMSNKKYWLPTPRCYSCTWLSVRYVVARVVPKVKYKR